MRVTHLNKSGSGFTSKTACGRNILRTPFSTDWATFKQEPVQYRCIKCAASKQFEVNTRMDAKKEIQLTPEQYNELELAMQWPEDLARWDRINTPTNLTEIEI